MNKSRVWLLIEIIAAIILLILIAFFVKRKVDDYNYLKEQKDWKESLEIGAVDRQNDNWILERDEKAIAKVKEIQKRHPSVVGIIEIPGTDILYPMVQGKDNQFYLNHDKDGNPHVFGEIYLDARNKNDFTDKNTVIYGHNIRQAKTLFHSLIQYEDQEYFDKHKIINIYSTKGFKSYDIIQTFHADPKNPYRETQFPNEQEYLDFLNRYQEASMIKTGYQEIKDKESKNLITLSTCFDKKTRMVIQAMERVEK